MVAEGVETREQADFLSELRCDNLQGYYFYKPLSIEDCEELLSRDTLVPSILMG